jgi:hypothetical protein
MPSFKKKIHIPGKTAFDLYQKADISLSHFLEKYDGKIGKIECVKQEEQMTLILNSKFFKAFLKCEDAAFDLRCELSLMALPFRGKIEEGIDHWIKKHF